MIQKGLIYLNDEEEIFNISNYKTYKRGILTEIHIADIHFGRFEPSDQYKILKEQFIEKIKDLFFDVLCIDGDLFDRKVMSNSDVAMYASMFISEIVSICKNINATLVILHGTRSHDSNQLKLFYQYINDKSIDIRIVEETSFEYIKGSKILCIPEEYGRDEEYYNKFLYNSPYDGVYMHGNLNGAIYLEEEPDLGSKKAPVFTIENFCLCRGPIISGHVHIQGCYNTYFYYCGSPYRWQFGEEQDKGFLIVLRNLDEYTHYTHFEKIISDKYITINIDDIIMQDPKDIISYISKIKLEQNIDYIRIQQLSQEYSEDENNNIQILKNYYRNNSHIKIHNKNKKKNIIEKNIEELEDKYKEYQYILDKSLTEHEILTKYINHQKEYEFITVDELISILKEI